MLNTPPASGVVAGDTDFAPASDALPQAVIHHPDAARRRQMVRGAGGARS